MNPYRTPGAYLIQALLLCTVLTNAHAQSVHPAKKKAITNSIGMALVPISPGSFNMGATETSFSLDKKNDFSKDAPYYDETPVHKVTITYPFLISQTEVTEEQYRLFNKEYHVGKDFSPYVSGISWNDAMAFCQWLSKKEGKPYRLPTEAEWEYSSRAGATSMFWSGATPPPSDVNPWGLKGMASGVAEWCYDWYGPYTAGGQTDPVGYQSGWAKVVRGGPASTSEMDEHTKQFGPIKDLAFYRSANRGSLQPDCPAAGSTQPAPHYIGFRVVQAALPKTEATAFAYSFPLQGVIQNTALAVAGPDPAKPYFKARQVMASPPDLTMPIENETVGLDPANQGKVHSSGIVGCPNGDLLLIGFSSSRTKSESAPNATMVVTRLRNGAEEWELPEVFYDRSSVNDQSALLWNDNGTLWFFGGGRGLGTVPFVFTKSTDNGATWTPLTTPLVKGEVGPFAPQPITSAFRGSDGTIYFGSDAEGSTSLLWASHDNGKTWYDTGGRTHGRHTAFIPLKDNRILAMGGKNSNVDGYMPKSYSSDNGKTWTDKIKTPFAALGSNQRPTIMRLKDGKLFFAGDFQDIKMMDIPPPKDITERGAYVALSDDEGETWKIKRLAMAPQHNDWTGRVAKGKKPQQAWGTLGYCDVTQSPNGVINLMTSKGKPSMHFAFNEAWILSDFTGEVNELPGKVDNAKLIQQQETYKNGKARVSYSGWTSKDGFVLHGKQAWFWPNGQKQYEANYNNGHIEGVESYWNTDGSLNWTRDHTPYGTIILTKYWPDGKKKSESSWVGLTAHGPATLWDANGKVVREMMFYEGRESHGTQRAEL
ncbi:formylglycine-generating enzyme required for sulfatase activity [Mucilaginibacter yixingensis]|uniref:Formylglycine-generating enzyme required for sulfatase activity n=1 Tax=Mucilaginibacter yixingensis TaxID=1295612 RepID=A0A2T5JCA9_9SPHI|nr:SUMF1/EgtB/PvdO family nonheme iron enzyme [Mucilaginibacter yixingensis]PTQ99398.1 formylglycine-generating enzyme required for sulfatase activity [Mucilaginibacter yixingensis]